jgi:hypothetical protein
MLNYIINIKENRPIINILGEICWGFQVENFEKKIGAKKQDVEVLLMRFLQEEKSGVLETRVTDFEINIIKKALVEVEAEIEEWEFETRIGVTLAEIKNLKIFR